MERNLRISLSRHYWDMDIKVHICLKTGSGSHCSFNPLLRLHSFMSQIWQTLPKCSWLMTRTLQLKTPIRYDQYRRFHLSFYVTAHQPSSKISFCCAVILWDNFKCLSCIHKKLCYWNWSVEGHNCSSKGQLFRTADRSRRTSTCS